MPAQTVGSRPTCRRRRNHDIRRARQRTPMSDSEFNDSPSQEKRHLFAMSQKEFGSSKD